MAYAASSVLATAAAKFSFIPKWKAAPVALALIVIVAGTIRNVDRYQYNSSITRENWEAMHQIGKASADMVLISGAGKLMIGPVYPDLCASAHYMGWGRTGFVRNVDEDVPAEVAEAIEPGGAEEPNTILVLGQSKAEFDTYYPSWSALLGTYFDHDGDISGPSIWAGHYTRKEATGG